MSHGFNRTNLSTNHMRLTQVNLDISLYVNIYDSFCSNQVEYSDKRRQISPLKVQFSNTSFSGLSSVSTWLWSYDFDQILTYPLSHTLSFLDQKNKPFFLFFYSFEHYTDWFARYDQDCSRWSTCWYRTANRWYAHAIYYKRNMLNIGRHPCQHWFGDLRCPTVGQEGWLIRPAFNRQFFGKEKFCRLPSKKSAWWKNWTL